MDSLILSTEDIRQIVRRVGVDALMDELIARLTSAFATYDEDSVTVPARSGFAYQNPHLGLIEWMPVMQVGEQVTIKIVGYHPSNPVRFDLPTIISTISTYDTRTGHLVGVADGTFVTALRTGAASAIASQLLAHPDSATVGLIGAGAQALTQLHALSRRFDLRRAVVFDTDTEAARSFARRAAFIDLDVACVEGTGLAGLVAEADILCTTTSIGVGCGPVFEDHGCRPWLHVNAVGSDFPGKFEVPLSLLQRSLVCPDFRAQAIKEGECQRLATHQIGPDLYRLIQQPGTYSDARLGETVFDSTGWALEDHIALMMMLDYAADLGLGTRMGLEAISADPHNPYAMALPTADEVVSSRQE